MVYFGGFFSQTGIFARFSLHIINLAVRISAAVMAGAIIVFSTFFARMNNEAAIGGRGGGGGGVIVFFRVPSSLEGCDGWGEGGEHYISKPWWYSGKIYALGSRVAH